MAENEPNVPMIKMYVIFESEFPVELYPEMQDRVQRLGAHLARISFSNEQLSMFDFDKDYEKIREGDTEWYTLDQWTNNYLLDYLRVHPSDRPGSWPTRTWHQIAKYVDVQHVKEDTNGEIAIHTDGIRGFAEHLKQGKIRNFTGSKGRELLFMFLRNHPDEQEDKQ